jgi:hypothetical protein
MLLHSAGAQAKSLRDLAVAQARGGPQQDFDFPGGQVTVTGAALA